MRDEELRDREQFHKYLLKVFEVYDQLSETLRIPNSVELLGEEAIFEFKSVLPQKPTLNFRNMAKQSILGLQKDNDEMNLGFKVLDEQQVFWFQFADFGETTYLVLKNSWSSLCEELQINYDDIMTIFAIAWVIDWRIKERDKRIQNGTDPFYMCMVDGKEMPKKRHHYESAITEANRLANLEKKKVFVLRAIEVVDVETVTTVTARKL